MSDFEIVGGKLIKYTGKDDVVKIPDGVVEIGDNCFENSKIKNISFPSTLKKIGCRAFINAKNLSEVNIPDSVTVIDLKSFMNCERIKKVTLSKNIKEIAWKCFFGCKSLKKIVIPEGVTSIAADAFWGCNEMKYCILPHSLEYIGDTAFGKEGYYDEEKPFFIICERPHDITYGYSPFDCTKPVFLCSIDQIPWAKNL